MMSLTQKKKMLQTAGLRVVTAPDFTHQNPFKAAKDQITSAHSIAPHVK